MRLRKVNVEGSIKLRYAIHDVNVHPTYLQIIRHFRHNQALIKRVVWDLSSW